eukprot:5685924-Amphidinium_carterae.2
MPLRSAVLRNSLKRVQNRGKQQEGMSLPFFAKKGFGPPGLHSEECAKNKNVKVTAIFGNNFLEFPMAAAIILADPSEHPKW